MDTTAYLLIITVLSIILLLVLVIYIRIHAFVSLLLVSAAVGLAAGMPFRDLLRSIQDGMGGILGYIAIIVGLGAILGKLLEVSGGAETMAGYIVKTFGTKRSPWALVFVGFIISIPVFIDVGFIILVPIVYTLAKKSGLSVLHFAIPLLAGMAVTHSFIPPTPGPVAVSEILGAPLGLVIIFGTIAGIPTAILAGPIFGKYIGRKIIAGPPEYLETTVQKDLSGSRKDFFMVLFVIMLPLVLILGASVFDVLVKKDVIPQENYMAKLFQFLGHPFSALAIATLVAVYFLGIRKGFKGKQIMKFSDRALAPAGLIILVTGAGGVFKQILIESGAGEALAEILLSNRTAPVFLAYLLAVIIRVTQGSATVAMITSAGMMAPIMQEMAISDESRAIIVIAIASGATMLSHVNDSGFWLVSKYLGLSEKQTLQSWTVMESIISVAGFTASLLLYFFFSS